MFAFGLNSLFELLEVSEDCYGIGYLSKVIATELANLPAARTRRKVNRTTNKLISQVYKHVNPPGYFLFCTHLAANT